MRADKGNLQVRALSYKTKTDLFFNGSAIAAMTTYSISITDDEHARIRFAKRQGLDVDAAFKGVIALLPRRRVPRTTKSSVRVLTRQAKPILPMPGPRYSTAPTVLPLVDEEKRKEAWAYFDEKIARFAQATPEEIAEGERDFTELMENLRKWR